MLRKHVREQITICKRELEALKIFEVIQRMFLLWVSFDFILKSFDSILIWNEALSSMMIVVYVATIVGNFIIMYCTKEMKHRCRINIRNLRKRDKYYPIFH
jgi:formate hydrogenlyase subunit 3/multisubunit Na+/H+ antiporter MnhD subunit